MKKTLALGVSAALVAIGAWSFGCSSSSSGGPSTGADAGGADGSAALDGGRDTGGGDTGAPNPDQACAANGADADSCANCCIANHMTGQRTFVTAVHSCECGTNGTCRSQCANSFCAPDASSPDQQCLTCMTNDLVPDAGTPCYAQVDQACTNDPDCVAEQNCFGICP